MYSECSMKPCIKAGRLDPGLYYLEVALSMDPNCLEALTSLCMSSQQGPSLYKGQEISNMMSMHTIYDNGLLDHAHPSGLPDPLLPAGRPAGYHRTHIRPVARVRAHTHPHAQALISII